MRRTSINVWVLATVLPLLAGCPGSTLKKELSGIKQTIDTARKNGAYLCAPVELAMAESHYDFTAADLYYGDYFSAKDHIAITKDNADKALAKSPADRCAYKEERAVIVPKSGDADGDGIKDELDKCPDEPEDKDGFEDEDGCPDPDNDRDTLLDAVDKCPNDPEDFDQFEDQDGCPDVDNDGDKVLDAAQLNRNPDGTYTWTNNDKKMENGVELDCRNRPEDFDGVEDEDGCPDVLKIDNCQIKLSDKIYFKFNKWDIDPKSFKVLDEVRDTMNNAPDIKIWIDGHTDSKGSNKFNKTLSQKRVDSVKKHLVEKGGIAPDRLEPRGMGESVPIADNKTADGRAANRRVEFNLKDCTKSIQ